MELTQKIENTQQLQANASEEEVPDQIGFLGICGVKYPLKKGPNKIGRDPGTCNIVLNLNSISRQHAVINILNSYDFMLMDLDSANKTKLGDKTLQAYIPTPLKNGDMVQFGQVFGVFRLFEEENDLPMTQALVIPETPVRNQHVSKVNHITTIPESPEISDRDDSFIVASQPKSKNVFKSPNTNFIKTSGKNITIQPVGSNKIDNIYWSSSKKSDSFNLESDTYMNTDTSLQISKTKENIHEQETQVHNTNNYIYEADTQIGENLPTICNVETQLSRVDNLPEVHKIHDQENININLFTENKENVNNIYNSETQDVPLLIGTSEESNNLNRNFNKNDESDDIILFDEIENNPLEESFESQPLLLPQLEATDHIKPINEKNIKISDDDKKSQNVPISDRRDSGNSTDCEDINFALTQKIPEKRICDDDDDTTDCEEAPELTCELNKTHNIVVTSNVDDNFTDYEDEIEDNDRSIQKKIDDIHLEDLATQIIEEIPGHCSTGPAPSKNILYLEDLPTQIIEEEKTGQEENFRKDQLHLEDLPTQLLLQESQNINFEKVSPFKVPAISPFKRKGKEQIEAITNKVIADKNAGNNIDNEDEEKYYALTQELLNDLCTQREFSNLSNQSNNISNTDIKIITEDIDDKIDKFVMNLTNSAIKNVDIGEEATQLKKVSSDSSDFESTPKKINPLSFLETKLPNTQEIKNYLKINGYDSTESSKGSDTDCSNRDSPYKNKKNIPKVVKRVDLTTKFETQRLPDRIITRGRKPNTKMPPSEDSKMNSYKIFQPTTFDHSKGKETNALSSAISSDLKKKTNKTDLKKTNVSKETNKRKDNKKCRESNKSKESKNIEEMNKSKISKNIKENNRSKENYKMLETVESKENNIYPEKKQFQDKNKSNSRLKSQEKNNNEHILNVNEKKSTRKSSRTKDKQNDDKKENKRLNIPIEKLGPLKIETANSITKTGEGSHSKTNRNNSNTIDKYLSSTSGNSIKKDETKTTEKRSSRSKNKEPTNHEASIAAEVRRSKRKRTAKKSFDTIEPKSKQIKPSDNEQSAVYNISSESGVDSPNKLKRQASNFNLPIAKKNKTINNSNVVLRSTPARKIKTHYILFTAFPCDEVKVKLEKIGAVVVSDIMQCTVVLTLQIKRTFKLLCAVGLGKPIVGPNWVQACVDTNMIVDPWLYLIKDELTEKRFQFNLERILLSNRRFLKGYNVSSTPNIMPSPSEMKLIVECSGGTWTSGGKNWICVSSNSDKSLWTSLKRKGAIIVSTEFILGGVLRQTIDIERNVLA